jgi:hypothetical protein
MILDMGIFFCAAFFFVGMMVLSLLHGVNRFSFGQSAVAAKRAPDAVHQSGPMVTYVAYKIITKRLDC